MNVELINVFRGLMSWLVIRFLSSIGCFFLYSCILNRQKYLNCGATRLVSFQSTCDTSWFCPNREYELSQRNWCSTSELRLVVVGSLEQRKRVIEIAQIAANFSKECRRPIKLSFVGDGALRNDVFDVAKFSNSPLKVEVLGFVNMSGLPNAIGCNDVGICVSTYDPSPKAIHEMLSCGVPVISMPHIGTANELLLFEPKLLIKTLSDLSHALAWFSQLNEIQVTNLRKSARESALSYSPRRASTIFLEELTKYASY